MGSRIGFVIVQHAKSSKKLPIKIVSLKDFKRTQTNPTGRQRASLVQAQSVHTGQNLNSWKFLNKRAPTGQSC